VKRAKETAVPSGLTMRTRLPEQLAGMVVVDSGAEHRLAAMLKHRVDDHE
jgi:hypothetical protein